VTETTKKWADVRAAKVGVNEEGAARASALALMDALALRDLRTVRGLTQVEIAQRLGRSQGNVSELERRDDVYLSSLREYIEALGGRLELIAVFPEERIPVSLGAPRSPGAQQFAARLSTIREAAAAAGFDLVDTTETDEDADAAIARTAARIQGPLASQ
jgi:transcriptional regulator with XRE-family HTH domain